MTVLIRRVVFLALLFALELAVVTFWLDNAQLSERGGLTAAIRVLGPGILRVIVGFAAIYGAVGFTKYGRALSRISADLAESPVSGILVGAHFASMALFLFLSARMYAAGQAGPSPDTLALAWLVAGIAAIGLGSLAFVPFRFGARILAATGPLWIYSLAAGVVASVAGSLSRSLWPVATRITFFAVRASLGLFGPVMSDPARMSIGMKRFSVWIAPECSGLEGIGLILVFGVLWLTIFRRECRFPRALLLLPAGVVFMFLLNSARITALILLGAAGAGKIALGGFHSQAGWIIFNLGAIGFSVAARRARWLTVPVAGSRDVTVSVASGENRNAVWLLPLVAVLAAGMISHAMTGDFEWLYPLRFFSAVAVVWYYRNDYRMLDWRIGWQAPAMGALVFLFWIVTDRRDGGAGDGMPAALRAAAPGARVSWIVFRALAASVTVPFVEELAFRGYLLRRLISPQFEAVQFPAPNIPAPNLPWVPVLISSVAFGLLHGERWLAGTVAGVCYALVYMYRGRVAEAVVAHGITNALIAVDVLAFQRWQLW